MLRKRIVIDERRCSGCGRCRDICPTGAIKVSATGLAEVDSSSCNRCCACKRICKQRAIRSRIRLQF